MPIVIATGDEGKTFAQPLPRLASRAEELERENRRLRSLVPEAERAIASAEKAD
jgi:hypothetical protein